MFIASSLLSEPLKQLSGPSTFTHEANTKDDKKKQHQKSHLFSLPLNIGIMGIYVMTPSAGLKIMKVIMTKTVILFMW